MWHCPPPQECGEGSFSVLVSSFRSITSLLLSIQEKSCCLSTSLVLAKWPGSEDAESGSSLTARVLLDLHLQEITEEEAMEEEDNSSEGRWYGLEVELVPCLKKLSSRFSLSSCLGREAGKLLMDLAECGIRGNV